MDRIYLCIDLKSFYASAECADRGLDPFKTNLVVADPSRGRGAICLAITPALKKLGVKNRCRIFEIPKGIEYVTAMPRMKRYMEISADIYSVYLKYVSSDDIHVYSIDECFIDATGYLCNYGMTSKEFAKALMDDVYRTTGIRSSAGIGTNLFLAKVALDITAKHSDDFIGYLNEEEFKRTIWHHKPITDIWNVGKGTANRLLKYGIDDLYGVAHFDEKKLYKEFGVNAEYLIDHAKGYEPCTINDIHEYRSKSNSISNSQILFEDYNFENAFLIMKEMVDLMTLELAERHLATNVISLSIGYSKDSSGPTGGSKKLASYTSSYETIVKHFEEIYMSTTKREEPIRRLAVGLGNVIDEDLVTVQYELFPENDNEKERKLMDAVVSIKKKYGKNSILRGTSFEPKSTARERNKMIGGHNGE